MLAAVPCIETISTLTRNTTGDCLGGMKAKLARTRVLPEKWEPVFR